MIAIRMVRSARIGLVAPLILAGSVAGNAGNAWAQWINIFDLTPPYGGSSADRGRSIVLSQGKIYTAGMSHGQYAVARVDGLTGLLDPGTSSAPWGNGIQSNPTTDPVGWIAVQPGTGFNQSAADMVRQGGRFYLTGAANVGDSAGFAVIARSNGSLVGNVKTMRPGDIHYAWYSGASPGGGIRVLDGYAYVFGQTTIPTYSDILWAAKRELDGDPTFDFGEACPSFLNPTPNCPANGQTGFSILEVGHQSAEYRDTAMLGKVAYSLASVTDAGEGRILVAMIDLTNPSTAAFQILIEEGGVGSSLRPFAIAVQSDGKILVAGSGDVAPNTKMFVIRYNGDGSRDTTFSGNGRLNINPTPGFDQINDIAVLPTGKIFAVGAAGAVGATPSEAISLRINSDGTLDTTYSTTGYIIHTLPNAPSSFEAVTFANRVRATGGVVSAGGSDLLVADLAGSMD